MSNCWSIKLKSIRQRPRDSSDAVGRACAIAGTAAATPTSSRPSLRPEDSGLHLPFPIGAGHVDGLARSPVHAGVEHRRGDRHGRRQEGLDLLHRHKLRVLRRIFNRYYRGRVLDIGCGLSLFTAYGRMWPFSIVAGDLVAALMIARRSLHPDVYWLVFDASRLPFKDGCFDGIFAGEIIEHLPDQVQAVKEWNRVQKTGGVLVITTPNRGRRINRLNKQDWPVSPDPLRELSYEDINHTVLPQAGYRLLRKKGLYLELFTNSNRWWKEDFLQREGNRRKYVLLMKLLFVIGHLFPRRSLDLVSVARKASS